MSHILNFNIGLLGHVDSGKTSLAKQLSTISSTACFDKNPQSKERGITLDLGFSSFMSVRKPNVQYTLVDCPGHASLIKTIIGGAQIIDLMILVVDLTKGIQTQTAECLILGEILCPKLLVAFNKVDLIKDEKVLEKTKKSIKMKLANMEFKQLAFCQVSALTGAGINESLLPILDDMTTINPNQEKSKHDDFLMAVDHCFQIKGKGSILTGTVLSGSIAIDQELDLPEIGVFGKKVKGIQVFKKPVTEAKKGDRCGVCIAQFDQVGKFERGVACKKNKAKWAKSVILELNAVKYYKKHICSKEIFHVTVGHSTRTAKISLFKIDNDGQDVQFKINDENKEVQTMETDLVGEYSRENKYLFVNENRTLGAGDSQSKEKLFVKLDFGEKPILFFEESLFIASKLDFDSNNTDNAHLDNNCRLAFHGKNLDYNFSPDVFKIKFREGTVDKLYDADTIIVKSMFKKETNLSLFKDMNVVLETGERGRIIGPFGKSGKIKVELLDEIEMETLEKLDVGVSNEKPEKIKVHLRFMKKAFDKSAGLIQF